MKGEQAGEEGMWKGCTFKFKCSSSTVCFVSVLMQCHCTVVWVLNMWLKCTDFYLFGLILFTFTFWYLSCKVKAFPWSMFYFYVRAPWDGCITLFARGPSKCGLNKHENFEMWRRTRFARASAVSLICTCTFIFLSKNCFP